MCYSGWTVCSKTQSLSEIFSFLFIVLVLVLDFLPHNWDIFCSTAKSSTLKLKVIFKPSQNFTLYLQWQEKGSEPFAVS